MKQASLFIALILALAGTNLCAQPYLMGVTPSGGDGFGTIFKTDIDGTNHEVLTTFAPNVPGSRLKELVRASNGKLYGVTGLGGANGSGVLYEYDLITHSYIKKIDFSNLRPNSPLMEAANGKLYGSGIGGGVALIYEYDIATNSYNEKIKLSLGADVPVGAFVQASNGKLYGMTHRGGAAQMGTIFEYDLVSNTLTHKIDLNSTLGTLSFGSLIQASNGRLYGMTSRGGIHDSGVIFEYDYSANIYTKKFEFSTATGGIPFGTLMLAANGKLYGVVSGGPSAHGVIFEYDYTTGTYTHKHGFDNINGSAPRGALVEAGDGKLYGTTLNGGTSNNGVIFEFDYLNNIYSKRLDMNTTRGYALLGSLVQGLNGKLYGVADSGGQWANGVLFEFDYAGPVYTKIVDFGSGVFSPAGSLLQLSNGKIYGTMSEYSAGIIFEFDPLTNTHVKKFDFSLIGGGYANGFLMQASNGKLYGVGAGGKENASGMLFEYDHVTNSGNRKINFNYVSGSGPVGALVEASNGKLYGMTTESDFGGSGTIFEYDYTTNTYAQKFQFIRSTGMHPEGGLMQAHNGKLYGMTYEGGVHSVGGNVQDYSGVIFEYDHLSNTYTKKIDLNRTIGCNPIGSLIQGFNGKLYGLTGTGGLHNHGVLFEYDPASNNYVIKYHFDGISGRSPHGTLSQSSNGKLYGMTSQGGEQGFGVIFEYDYNTDEYTIKHAFKGYNGAFPLGGLIEVCSPRPEKPAIDITYSDLGIATLTASTASGYTWFKNGVNIEGATAQTYTATANAEYIVVVSNDVNCKSLPSDPAVVIITANEEGQSPSSTQLYPNPAIHYLYIGASDANAYIKVNNTLGAELQIPSQRMKDQFRLDVGGIPAGIYHVIVITKNQKRRLRFVKQ